MAQIFSCLNLLGLRIWWWFEKNSSKNKDDKIMKLLNLGVLLGERWMAFKIPNLVLLLRVSDEFGGKQ